MFGSLWSKVGVTLKRSAINEGESLASPAKYFLFTAFQNQNVFVISNSRVTSIFYSFYTTTNLTDTSDSSNSFVVSYLINSCGLSQDEAITASKKLLNFKTASNPDSVIALFKTYGFTEPHISKIITKNPSILSSNPHQTIKPKLDFFNSKGLYELDLANFISREPLILENGLNKGIIPTFDILKSIVQSDQNVIKMIKRNAWYACLNIVRRLMINVGILRDEGVPEFNISKYLSRGSGSFAVDAGKFRKIVEKAKGIGFHPTKITFLVAIDGLASLKEANWRNKMDVYKRWGWSEDQVQSAFRNNPGCMMASEKKIMAIMNFLVNEMGYDSSSIAKTPILICYSLKERIIPRFSVIRILVSRGLIKEKIAISTISTMVDKSFLEKFVIKYEKEVPQLMEVFQGQLNYQHLLHS